MIYQSSAISRDLACALLMPKFHTDSIVDRLPLRHIFHALPGHAKVRPPTNHLKRVVSQRVTAKTRKFASSNQPRDLEAAPSSART